MADERATYLKQVWSPYPEAPAGAVDVARFLRTGAGLWVCGRLLMSSPDRWDLASGGAVMPLAIALSPVYRVGDWVAVRNTESGFGAEVQLLAPARVEPRPLSIGTALERGRQWTCFLGAVRSVFASRGFDEARTPTLVDSPGTEPYLEAFSTHLVESGRVLRTLHLPTSPEFHLKRLLAAGWTRPFEIKDCFRNGESGPSHQPEFAMLEWYRAFETLDAIEIDIGDLLAECARALGAPEPPRPRVTTVRALFEQAHGFELRPETSAEDLRTLAFQLGLSPDPSDAWDDLFFRVFLHRIEPELGVDGPLIVRDYPPRLAALARLRPNGWADRLEVYWRGLELANGFHELNDPLENEARFAADAEVRLRLGRAPFPRDEALLEALRGGMPPAAGIALGLDRLFMALLGIGDIREARPFPI